MIARSNNSLITTSPCVATVKQQNCNKQFRSQKCLAFPINDRLCFSFPFRLHESHFATWVGANNSRVYVKLLRWQRRQREDVFGFLLSYVAEQHGVFGPAVVGAEFLSGTSVLRRHQLLGRGLAKDARLTVFPPLFGQPLLEELRAAWRRYQQGEQCFIKTSDLDGDTLNHPTKRKTTLWFVFLNIFLMYFLCFCISMTNYGLSIGYGDF